MATFAISFLNNLLKKTAKQLSQWTNFEESMTGAAAMAIFTASAPGHLIEHGNKKKSEPTIFPFRR